MLIPRLALTEFARSCSRRAAGGRDFLWMLLLMVFVQLLALVILSAREGVLERSVDAFLGNRPGYGIPIWTVPNILGTAQPVMITHDLVAEVTEAGFHGAPFRRVGGGDMIRMPAREVWRTPHGSGGFAGMAVSFDGPLHPGADRIAPGAVDGAWPIVLDERLFQRHFDLESYREALRGRVPRAQLDLIPDSVAEIASMPVIWLHTRTGRRDVLTPFNVTWSRHFGVGDDAVAFQVPARMHNAYRAAAANPALCVFLDGGPEFRPRVIGARAPMQLGAAPEDRALVAKALEEIAEAFPESEIVPGMRPMLDFSGARTGAEPCDRGVPSGLFAALAADRGLVLPQDQISLIAGEGSFGVDALHYSAACDVLSQDSLRRAEITGEGADCRARVTTADVSGGFPDMVMYARDRLAIKPLVDYLTCRAREGGPSDLCVVPEGGDAESRLMINRIYEDALIRFGFLTELLRAISGPIGAAMLLMLTAILWVQIGTVLGHRRVRYAMMLSNGLSWGQLRAMAVIQTLTATMLSFVLAFAVFVAVRVLVGRSMDGIAGTYERITFGRSIDVLPVNPTIAGIVFFAMLAVALLLTLAQLSLNAISPRRALDRLLG